MDLSGRAFMALFAAACIVAAAPVLAVATLPIVDYPNRLAHMHVILHADDAAGLGRFYAVQ